MPNCAERVRRAGWTARWVFGVASAVAMLTGAAVWIDTAVLAAQANSPAAVLFQANLSREAELRRAFDADAGTARPPSLLAQVRGLVRAYEDAWRAYPTSGYSDNSLWQAAMLAADAFWQFGDAADRRAALRLLHTLTERFPASSLIARVPPQIERLEAAKVIPSQRPATADHQPHVASNTVSPPTAAPAPGRTTPAVALVAIRRESLPDALRVTFELERETGFTSHVEGGRLFVELQNTRAADALTDARLAYGNDVVRQIRVGRPLNQRTRIVLDLDGAGRHSVYALYDPYRVVLDVERLPSGGAVPRDTRIAAAVPPPKPVAPAASAVPPPRNANAGPASTIGGADPVANPRGGAVVAPAVPTPPVDTVARAGVSVSKAIGATTVDASAAEARAQRPAGGPGAASPQPGVPSARSYSLSRQLGLGIARIVIDPGHGGHDPGAQVKGATEADLVLDVALRLEKLLAEQPGVEVVLTRRTDAYISLEERTAIANRAAADLFLSIHANASANQAARGIETYFLNFAPDSAAEAIAARENAGTVRTMRSLPDIVRSIALNDKIDESRDFAVQVQAALYEQARKSNREARNLGVKQAPFMVLIGATMPSVLAEISFMTNREEGRLLKTPKYRQQIAEALFAGIQRYQQSLKKTPRVAVR